MKLERSYTSAHAVDEAGTVRFACSTDRDEWPWLALGPRHPVVVQAQTFWASVGASNALGSMRDGQWSALTWADWRCGDGDAGPAVRGTYAREGEGENEIFVITFHDAEDREVVTMRGRGVVFRNRNFEQWRAEAKRKTAERAARETPQVLSQMAEPDALGLGPGEHPLIAAPENPQQRSYCALVTAENGLPPANRMLSGSGDHVNTVHMAEAARQALCLLIDEPAPTITGGVMHLHHYVELGTPFTLDVTAHDDAETAFALRQLGRDCAAITLRRT